METETEGGEMSSEKSKSKRG